jgi:hypothetical protein
MKIVLILPLEVLTMYFFLGLDAFCQNVLLTYHLKLIRRVHLIKATNKYINNNEIINGSTLKKARIIL